MLLCLQLLYPLRIFPYSRKGSSNSHGEVRFSDHASLLIEEKQDEKETKDDALTDEECNYLQFRDFPSLEDSSKKQKWV